MTHSFVFCTAMLCACLWSCDVVETSTEEQPGINLQGINLQGINLQGINLQGINLQGFQLGGATLSTGAPLHDLRVEKGELVAEYGQTTLRGTALAGVRLVARAQDDRVDPPETVLVTYRIASVVAESSAYDPTHTGSTYLYRLEQWVDDTASWRPACGSDKDGRRAAIPVAAIWDERGDRIESGSLFTFACTTGVIAKCYRWGYRPWVTGYGDLAEMHWTCTRLARADYCGNGVPHTRDGTPINVWDNLPAPGPIQKHGFLPPLGMIFEAGWGPHGAVCLSHARWLTIGGLVAGMCPDRLIPPGLGGIACNSILDVLDQDPTVRMFNESYLNLGL